MKVSVTLGLVISSSHVVPSEWSAERAVSITLDRFGENCTTGTLVGPTPHQEEQTKSVLGKRGHS